MATKKKQAAADLTVEILKQIRDDMRGLREEIAGVRTEIAQTNGKLDNLVQHTDARFDELNRLRVESETRLSTTLISLAQTMAEIRAGVVDMRQEQVNKLELRVRALEDKVAV